MLALSLLFSSGVRAWAYNGTDDTAALSAAPVMMAAVPPTGEILSLGAGAGGATTGQIMAGALPLIGLIAWYGFAISDPEAYSDFVNRCWNNLSTNIQTFMTELVGSGADSFTPSAELLSEFETALGRVFYEGGAFKDTFTFDSSNLLVYDYFSQYALTDDKAEVPNIYDFALTSTPRFITGTNLRVSLVDSPFQDMPGKALKVENTISGTSAVFTDTDMAEFLNSAHASYTISRPMIDIFPDNTAQFRTGFWILAECTQENCAEHEFSYTGKPLRDNTDLATAGVDTLFSGTGMDWLDGQVVAGQYFDGGIWKYSIGDKLYPMSLSTMSLLMADKACAGYKPLGQSITVPTDSDTVYLPTSDALADVSHLSQEGAKTGDWTSTVAEEGTGTDTDTEGKTLWDWLKMIWEAIIGVPGAIWTLFDNALSEIKTLVQGLPFADVIDAIKALPATVAGFFADAIDAIKALPTSIDNWFTEVLEAIKAIPQKIEVVITDVLTLLFVPDAAFFDEWIASINGVFTGRLGILTYPISVIYKLFDSFLEIGEVEPILRWNSWSYDGTEFIHAGEYNLNSILENDMLKTLHDIYLVCVDVFLSFALLRFAKREYDSILEH